MFPDFLNYKADAVPRGGLVHRSIHRNGRHAAQREGVTEWL